MHIPAPSLSEPKLPPDPTAVSLTRPTRVIAISSGKGGVGKSSISTNLGIALAKLGAKVCILDADTGLANINILLNLRPKFTIEHLLNGEKNINEIMLDGPDGIKVVPAASGISECAELNQDQHQVLSQALALLESRFDYLLIDTAAGIGKAVLEFLASAQYCILVITPEPTSLTDAFALIRVMKRKQLKQPIYTIVNRAASPQKANEIFRRFSAATKKYLRTRIGYMGSIAEDPLLSSAVYLQTPIIIAQPQSPASQCIQALATRIDNKLVVSKKPHHFSKYWHDKSQSSSNASDISAPKATSDTASNTELSGDYLSVAILSYLQYPETSKDQAKQLLQPLIDAALERFGTAAFNLPATAEPAKKTISAQIPTAGIASNISRLVSDIEEPEAAKIIQQLVSRHQRLFNKSPLNLENTFIETLCQTEINETQCSVMLETLRQYYREHFGDHEQDEKTKLIETFTEFSQQIQQREKQLDIDLQMLSEMVRKFSDTHT